MMQKILNIKARYYSEPTPLSEEIYHALVNLLSSKDDKEFYRLIESIFAYLSAQEDEFLAILRQKE